MRDSWWRTLLILTLVGGALMPAGCSSEADNGPGNPSNNSETSATPPPVANPAEAALSDPGPIDKLQAAEIAAFQVPGDTVIPYSEYRTDRALADLIKPHFFATSEPGDIIERAAAPELLTVRRGRAKLLLWDGNQQSFLDPLALESQLLGEHPLHKILRLHAMGVPMDVELAARLADPDQAAELFQYIDFEYLPGKTVRGVIAEVFHDGTFLVIPNQVPEDWQSDDSNISGPSHLHVNPRALIAGTSALAQAYEQEILSLPFDQQRYPPAPLAKQQCQVYEESVQHADYTSILQEVGYRFTPQQVIENPESSYYAFGKEMSDILSGGDGEGVRYYGYEREWISERMIERQVSWLGKCDAAGGIRSYRVEGEEHDRYYVIVRRSLELDKTQRYRLATIDNVGDIEEIYTAPGIMLMAQPLPGDGNKWLMSTEGWQSPEEDQSPDPRWQAVYLIDTDQPGEYQKVQYPISQFPKAPEAGLYGVSPRLTEDGQFLFNTLYGFKDEGGGIWVVDLMAGDFSSKPERFSRIVSWDHTLSWTVLGDDTDDAGRHLNVFMTGKEVADAFAMTANILRIRDAGLDSEIERQERLLQMVGWNPVPFGWQKISDTEFRVAVETHFNYESSLLPRAKGVYFVPVDTTP